MSRAKLVKGIRVQGLGGLHFEAGVTEKFLSLGVDTMCVGLVVINSVAHPEVEVIAVPNYCRTPPLMPVRR